MNTLTITPALLEDYEDAMQVLPSLDLQTTPPETLTEAMKATGELLRQFESLRKKAKAPLLAAGKAIDSTVKPYTTELERWETRLKGAVLAQAQLRQAERLAALAAQPEPDFVSDTAPAIPEALPVSTRVLQDLEITNPSKVPREYLIIDEKSVKEALLAGKAVPGARLVERTIVINR